MFFIFSISKNSTISSHFFKFCFSSFLALGSWKANDDWYKKSRDELKSWNEYVDKESGPTNQKLPSYAHAVGAIYRNSDPSDIAVTAAGGLVGEVIQVWKPRELNTHETEWVLVA